MKVIKFQDRLAMDNAEPGGDTTKNSVVAATNAGESLLFSLFPIFLISPMAIDCEFPATDSAPILAVKFDVTDEEGCGVTINHLFHLQLSADVPILKGGILRKCP
jgi:hypothetical protein